ncbi:MAG: NAD-dependent epimerase/dehydratase [Verrucomicrobiales bacterium]|nr:NAD-dependent epimerase/dehydratase [Verrucomicrobiales bacterium]
MLTALHDLQLLVTGAAGWLGLNLLQKISDLPPGSRPRQVTCLVLPGQDTEAIRRILPSITIIEGDVRNFSDCQRFCEGKPSGILIHTAGIIHPKKVSDFYDINLLGCENLLNAAVNQKLGRAVIVSSNSPCGCNPHPDHLFDEASPYNPYMHYGRSKMQMELAVQRISAKNPLKTVIIRAPWFYGPHQPARQTLFFKMIRDGKAPVVGNGENLRSMANTSKLGESLLLAAASDKAPGQIYWIADSRPYSMLEIIGTIESLLEEAGIKCAHKRMKLPGVASDIAYVVDKCLQAVGLYHQKFHVLSEMNKTIACNVQKAVTELGYEPATSLHEGMRASIKSCLSELHEQ